MKNVLKFFGIFALVAIIGFTMITCGGDDNPEDDGNSIGDLPQAGDGSISFASPLTASAVSYFRGSPKCGDDECEELDCWLKKYSGSPINFTHIYYENDDEYSSGELIPLSSIGTGTWNVTVSNSGLSLRFGTPYNNMLFDVSVHLPEFVTATENLSVFTILDDYERIYDSSGDLDLIWIDFENNARAGFVYADRDGIYKGDFDGYCEDCEMYEYLSYDLKLRKGWNRVIFITDWGYNDEIEDYFETFIMYTGKPGNSFKWIMWSYEDEEEPMLNVQNVIPNNQQLKPSIVNNSQPRARCNSGLRNSIINN